MLHRLIILNLLLALVLLPVAQAFASQLNVNMSMDSEQEMTQHCQQMHDDNSHENTNCQTSGMHCVDCSITAILFSNDLLFDQAKNSAIVKQNHQYFYISPRSLLRPPRLI